MEKVDSVLSELKTHVSEEKYEAILKDITGALEEKTEVFSLDGEESIKLYEEMYQSLSDARDELEKIQNEVNKKMSEDKTSGVVPEEKEHPLKKEDVQKVAATEAQKILAEEKQRLESAEKRKIEELKVKELEELKRKELEMKDKELDSIKKRLEIIEQERQNEITKRHDEDVRSVVDNMVKAGVLDEQEKENKFNTLRQLGKDALDELNSVIKKRLLTEPAQRIAHPANRVENNPTQTQTPSKKSPVSEIFEKMLDARKRQPEHPLFRGY